MTSRSPFWECSTGQHEHCPGRENGRECGCLCHERDSVTEGKRYLEQEEVR